MECLGRPDDLLVLLAAAPIGLRVNSILLTFEFIV